MPTSALFLFCSSHISPTVGTWMKRDDSPLRNASTTVPDSSRTGTPVMPCFQGNTPVPIVVWIAGVTDGEDPTVAFVYDTPSRIIRARFGQSSGHCSIAFQPPPSHTTVMI